MRTLAVLILALQLPVADVARAAPAKPADMQTAVLAGGCFWGVEAVYEHMRGVRGVVSGYAGPAVPATPNRCRSRLIQMK